MYIGLKILEVGQERERERLNQTHPGHQKVSETIQRKGSLTLDCVYYFLF